MGKTEMEHNGNNSPQIATITGGNININYYQDSTMLEKADNKMTWVDPALPFLDAVTKPLFYETLIVEKVGGVPATLKDIFVEPDFSLNNYLFEKIDEKQSIIQFINSFCKSTLLNNFIKRKKNVSILEEPSQLLIIVGEGGMGKSSLISMLAQHLISDKTLSSDKYYFLKLKDLAYSTLDSKMGISQKIYERLVRNDIPETFNNSVIFLDGFDEFCMLSDLRGEQVLTDLIIDIRNFCKQNSCKCVMTTRPTINADSETLMSTVLCIKLKLFTASILEEWVNKYTHCHSNISNELIRNYFCSSLEYEDCEIIFGIPLTNYMGFCASILDETFNISDYTNVFQIYDKIFGDDSILFQRIYDSSSEHPASKHEKQLRIFTKNIALEMFNKRKMYLAFNEIQSILNDGGFSKGFSNDDCNWLTSNLGVGFYINSHNGIVEFAHLTIQEYFAMDCFFTSVKNAYDKFGNAVSVRAATRETYEEFYNSIYVLIAQNMITDRMLEFFLYRLKALTMSEKIVQIENEYLLLKKSLLNFLLKDLSLFSSTYKTNSNKIIKYLFFNLWNINLHLNSYNNTEMPFFSDTEIIEINNNSNFKELFSWMSSEIKEMNSIRIPKIHLHQLTLAKLIIRDSDLNGSNLSYSNLSDLKIFKTNMTDAIFSYAVMNTITVRNSIFKSSDLNSTIIISCEFDNVVFDYAKINKTKFFFCKFYNCTFICADLSKAYFSECIFDNVDFRNAVTQHMYFHAINAKKLKISLNAFAIFYIYYEHGSDKIMVFTDFDNLATEDEILAAMYQTKESMKPVLIRKRTDELDSNLVYEATTVEDFLSISLEQSISRLTNSKISQTYSAIFDELLSGVTVDDIACKYDIEPTELKLIIDNLDNLLEVAKKYSIAELFREFDKIMLVLSRKMSQKKLTKNTNLSEEDIILFEKYFKQYAHENFLHGSISSISKVKQLVVEIRRSLSQGIIYSFSSLDVEYDEIFKSAGLYELYVDLKKFILLKKVLHDIL